jgi:hypothetical protein
MKTFRTTPPSFPSSWNGDSPYLHWWYSFSKDFGISGLRVGLLYSHNTALLEAWGNSGAPSITSNYVPVAACRTAPRPRLGGRLPVPQPPATHRGLRHGHLHPQQHNINYAPAAEQPLRLVRLLPLPPGRHRRSRAGPLAENLRGHWPPPHRPGRHGRAPARLVPDGVFRYSAGLFGGGDGAIGGVDGCVGDWSAEIF